MLKGLERVLAQRPVHIAAVAGWLLPFLMCVVSNAAAVEDEPIAIALGQTSLWSALESLRDEHSIAVELVTSARRDMAVNGTVRGDNVEDFFKTLLRNSSYILERQDDNLFRLHILDFTSAASQTPDKSLSASTISVTYADTPHIVEGPEGAYREYVTNSGPDHMVELIREPVATSATAQYDEELTATGPDGMLELIRTPKVLDE